MSNNRRPARDQNFPRASLDAALAHLRRPPAPDAVRFKIQNTAGDHAQVAAYVDARLVFDRLDLVCGKEWAACFAELPEPLRSPPCDRDGQPLPRPPIHVRCRLTIFGVTREDVGEGEDPKAAFSDAIKRAAVQFGVGRALYAMRAPWLSEGEGDGELRRNRRGKLVLDRRTEAWCRERYSRWLEERGQRMFGDPLEHTETSHAAGLAGGAESPRADAPPVRPDHGARDERQDTGRRRVSAAEGLRAVGDEASARRSAQPSSRSRAA